MLSNNVFLVKDVWQVRTHYCVFNHLYIFDIEMEVVPFLVMSLSSTFVSMWRTHWGLWLKKRPRS